MLEIMDYLRFKNRRTIRKYLNNLLSNDKLEVTNPDKPTHPKQKYVRKNQQNGEKPAQDF